MTNELDLNQTSHRMASTMVSSKYIENVEIVCIQWLQIASTPSWLFVAEEDWGGEVIITREGSVCRFITGLFQFTRKLPPVNDTIRLIPDCWRNIKRSVKYLWQDKYIHFFNATTLVNQLHKFRSVVALFKKTCLTLFLLIFLSLCVKPCLFFSFVISTEHLLGMFTQTHYDFRGT